MKKIKVAVVFGSRSVEHEVSIVTAMELFAALDKKKYEVTPIYIDKNGKWLTGDNLDKLQSYIDLRLKDRNKLKEYKAFIGVGGLANFDIVFLATHGAYGEDGTLQGLLEMMNVPYTGSGVLASSVGMDKIIQKAVFEKAGLPVVKYEWFNVWEYEEDSDSIIKRLENKIRYPMCVKPASLGSSVGISIVKTRGELESAIKVAKELDVRVVVEEALMGIDEINCAVMGVDKLEASVCEQPIKSTTVLSYDDKYLSGSKSKGMASMTRLIPAPIGEKMTKKIQEYAKAAFRSIDASGVARIDFLVNLKWKKVYVNEINTIPGGFSFYIWDKSGYSYSEVVDRLISLGFERFDKYNKLRRTFDTKLLKSAKGGSKFGN